MGRPLRPTLGGHIYHVLNRANGRRQIFDAESDYAAFERVLAEACQRVSMRLLSYCVMPNHWHLLLWPYRDGDLSNFMRWLTLTHTQRWHAHRNSVGTGHLYQGRFKSFLVQTDGHLLAACRYVERNPLRAKLVDQADAWPWGSLWRREHGSAGRKALLSEWPVTRPAQWVNWVNQSESEEELARLRQSVVRNQPFGQESWVSEIVERLELASTVRPQGRPRKQVS